MNKHTGSARWNYQFGASMAAVALVFGGLSSARAETLIDAIDLAYAGNPGLRAERERARIADEGVAQARSNFLPTISVTGQAGESQIETQSIPLRVSGNNVDLDPRSVSIQAVQPVFKGGRSLYSWKQANAAAQAAHSTYRSAEQRFLLSVISAYMDVRRDEQSMAIRENNVAVLRKQVDAAQARFKEGEGTKTDVAQAKARLSRGEAGLSSARAQLEESRAGYERIVGQKPGTLALAPALPQLALTLDDAIAFALANNPDVLAAKLSSDAADYAVGVSRSSLLPQADIVAQANDSRNSSFRGDRTESASVVGRVTIPIFDAGLARSQVRESKIRRSQVGATEEDTRNRVIEGVNTAWSQLLAARAVETASVAQVEANETAFFGVQEEQKVGLRTPLDVLDAEQELLDSRLSLARAQRDSYVAAHNLLASYGGLKVEVLKATVGSYNPEKHLRRVRRTVFSTGVAKLKGRFE